MVIIADEAKLNNDETASLLINIINELAIHDVNIYYNFPFYPGEITDDVVKAHVLFASKQYGVIFFRCIKNRIYFTESEKSKLDDLDSHIFSRITKREELRIGRRNLKINITPHVFVSSETSCNDSTFVGVNDIRNVIMENEKDLLTDEEFSILTSTIEGTVNLKQKKERVPFSEEILNKGRILSIIQDKLATFDIQQKRAALNIIDSPQRIRGLAGSGKTIILTMKAALYHLDNPDAIILYTYFTKALFGQIKYLIEKYYREFSDNRDPDWSKIHILHGWGGNTLAGVYSSTCHANDILPISFREAKVRSNEDPFEYVCKELEKEQLKKRYDLSLIDEGQDFPKHFYRLCLKITKNNRLVWAYDDFQNIFGIDIQNERETFGKDEKGNYLVDFSLGSTQLQDIILYKCYRNPRFALLTAFSLGLGIYNDKVLQRLENNKYWEDLGFEVESGQSKDYDNMIISRPNENSPIESNLYFKEDSVVVEVFSNISDECNYVIDKIENDIINEGLLPDDICVIGLDAKNIGSYFNIIQRGLMAKSIKVFNLLDAASNNTYFNIKKHVTLSTINKAKGNETAMVYIVGVDAVFKQKDFIIDRNKIFTAITRSKGWVTITGFREAQICKKEIMKLRENNYKFNFIQPSKNETKTILRGLTAEQSVLNDVSKKIEEYSKNTGKPVEEIISLLVSQNVSKKI